jgi:hypothetical protein
MSLTNIENWNLSFVLLILVLILSKKFSIIFNLNLNSIIKAEKNFTEINEE